MRKFYTAEAVTEGHPDKLCDQIADAILDVCLKQDEQSRVACEVLATKGTIIVAGEITSTYEPDVFAVVRKVLSDVGYSSEGIAMDTFVHRQSPDIAGACLLYTSPGKMRMHRQQGNWKKRLRMGK